MLSREEILDKIKSGKFSGPNSEKYNSFIRECIIPELSKPSCILCKDCIHYAPVPGYCNELDIYVKFFKEFNEKGFGCIRGESKEQELSYEDNKYDDLESINTGELISDMHELINKMGQKIDTLKDMVSKDKLCLDTIKEKLK